MKTFISIVVFAGLLFTVEVRSESASLDVTVNWHNLLNGIQKMRQSGKFNYPELVEDLNNLVKALQSSAQNPSLQLQKQIEKVQSGIKSATASGSPDPNQVRSTIQSAFDLINSNYPALKRNAKPL